MIVKIVRYVLVLLFLANSMACNDRKKTEVSEVPGPKDQVLTAYSEGTIEVLDERLWDVLPEDGNLEIIAEGHDWTEGPLWIAENQQLLYSDIPKNAIYSWKSGEKAKQYLHPSGFLGTQFEGEEPGSNGLLLNKDGKLILCQHGERRIAMMDASTDAPDPVFHSLADMYDGKRLNSPNDAVFNKNGELFFTDPPYGLPKRMDDPNKELDFQGVYKLRADGKVILLTSEFSRPNGIAFSPDEKKIYIANSDPDKAIWKVFEISGDATLGEGKLLYDATSLVAKEKGLPDGLKVHSDGTVFATGPGGIFLFSPEGTLLGKIKTGQATSNCAFNEDESVLFITADSYVLQLRLK